MFNIRCVLVWISACGLTFGKVFQPLELSQELKDLGVPDWDIPLLVCHAHHISDLRTNFNRTSDDDDHENAFGIFGLNFKNMDSTLWHHCWLPVNDLTDDDIADDVKCLLEFLSRSKAQVEKNNGTTMSRGQAIAKLLNWHGPDFFTDCIDWWTNFPPTLYDVTTPCQSSTTEIVVISFLCVLFNLIVFCCSVWLYIGSKDRRIKRLDQHFSFTNLQALDNVSSVHM